VRQRPFPSRNMNGRWARVNNEAQRRKIPVVNVDLRMAPPPSHNQDFSLLFSRLIVLSIYFPRRQSLYLRHKP
jgi:hypothetical protein